MRAAIVGCGSIAHVHAAAIHQIEGTELVAFADIVPERARNFQEKYGGKAYASLEEMLDCEKIDVLHICTPHYLHVPMLLYAVKHNVHVFSEKPPVISAKQLHQLLNLKTSKHFGFCFQNRYNASIRLVKEMLASGVTGKILGARGIVTWGRDASYYTDSGWRGRLATEGGGVLINQSIHTMDLLVYLLGKPLEVEASIQNHHLKNIIEVEDTMEAYIRFAGLDAIFYASTAYSENVPPIIELSCENLLIRIEDQSVICLRRDGTVETPELPHTKAPGKNYWGSGHQSCIQDFYLSILENRNFPQDLTGTLDTICLMLGAYRSAKTGKPIKLDSDFIE